MKTVAKYNICKSVSTLLTVGTPIATLAFQSELFVHRSDTALSAAGVFAILFAALFFKDKIAENFKCPSAFVVSTILFLLLTLTRNIIEPMREVCLTTMCACGVDELTFKKMYKAVEKHLPPLAEDFKHIGLYLTTSDKLGE